MLAYAKPYPEDHPALNFDSTEGDEDRLMANVAAAFLQQDDEERARLGLRENEYPEVNGGKVYKIYE